jgi:predicted lipoprotein with Yx(FWY)xxD motif
MRLLVVTVAAALVAAPAAQAGPTVVKTAHNTNLKTTILVDARGRTLYFFVSDSPDMSSCSDDPTYHCSKHWIPLRTRAAPVAANGAKQALLGTTQRDDGTTQVTYKHRPLYTWIGGYGIKGDKKPGDIAGQRAFGLWFALSPAGRPIK